MAVTWRSLNTRYRLLIGGLLAVPAVALLFYLLKTTSYRDPAYQEPLLQTSAFMNTTNPRYSKFAVAVKTGREIALKRVPIQLMTFLKGVENVVLIGEAAGVWVGKHEMVDVITHLYDYEANDESPENSDDLIKDTSSTVEEKTHGSSPKRWAKPSRMKPSIKRVRGGKDIAEVTPDEDSTGWLADAHKNLPGFKEMWNRFPDASWYLMIDDDTYIFMDHLDNFLSQFDPKLPHYLGAATIFTGCDEVHKLGDGPLFGHGGSGIVLSHGALEKIMSEGVMEECIDKYKSCFAGDIRLGLCLRDSGILIRRVVPYVFNRDPPHSLYWYPDPCDRPITFHHLLVAQIQKLYDLEQKTKQNYPFTTFSEIFLDWIGDSDGEPVIGDRRGSDITSYSAETSDECREKCRIYSTCVSYTFSDGKCFLKSGIPVIRDETTTSATTGYFSAKYICASDKRKNYS